jgi:hypothetical protein
MHRQEDHRHRLFLPHLEDHEWERLVDEGLHASGMKVVHVPEDLAHNGSLSVEWTNEIAANTKHNPPSTMRTIRWSDSLTSSLTRYAWDRGLQWLSQVHPHRPACITEWELTNPHIGGGVLATVMGWNKL